MTASTNNQEQDDHLNKYLIFEVGDGQYGVPLLEVREVIEPEEVHQVANTVPHFLGVINVRGEIVGVVDLRVRMNKVAVPTDFMAMIIFETVAGPIAAIVDRVTSVSTIFEQDIDNRPNIQSDFPLEYLVGVGKVEDHLVSIVKLNHLMGVETLNDFRSTKLTMRK